MEVNLDFEAYCMQPIKFASRNELLIHSKTKAQPQFFLLELFVNEVISLLLHLLPLYMQIIAIVGYQWSTRIHE